MGSGARRSFVPPPRERRDERALSWYTLRTSVHTTRRAFEHDRRRDQRLALLGYRVIRFTWRQVMFEPEYVAATLAALL
jgi:very-short-patch-repair endonuclease